MKDFFEMTSTCIQGGYPRTLGGFQTPNLGPHSPPMAWQYPPVIQNQPATINQVTSNSEERNDSGINSGSDCHSSSPGSENGTESFNNRQSKVAYYSTPIFPRASYHSSHMVASPTYPTLSHVKSEPEEYDDDKDSDTTLTNNNDALKRLEMSVEKNLNLSVSSPGISENSNDDRSDLNPDEYDENGHKIPRVNSHGKIKTFKCKQCAFVAITKFDFWEHQRQHIRPEKLLTCHKCPFVTEYKHHLEYHLRNHDGSKPFKCEHCDYTCVNKSMLNSHKKSHSNIYQYRCAECHYASKYCHSLKLHLRKYNHQPAMVLNPDGSPNPLPIIDVYGTRRGPKVKPLNLDDEDSESQPKMKKPKTDSTPPPQNTQTVQIPQPPPPNATSMLPLPLQQLITQTPPMQVPLAYSWLQQAMIYQNLERLARENLSSEDQDDELPTVDSSGALDLTKDNKNNSEDVLKLDTPSTSSDEEDTSTTMFSNVEVVQNEQSEEEKEIENLEEKKDKRNEVDEKKNSGECLEKNFSCQYCSISFGDAVLYTMHMGYHGYQDPFACNMCGEKCNDKVSFFLHIARTSHS